MNVVVAAYAKLNLALRVLGLREDGYHEIISEVQTIDLADRLTIESVPEGICVESDLALHGGNLVEEAARVLFRKKRCSRGVRIRVEKRIPVGAGLGGGSSDAAAILTVLDRATPPKLAFDTLREVAAGIGSDVPLFLHGGRVRITGRGEGVETLPGPSTEHFVVLVPPVHCATAEIYARWDELAAASNRLPKGVPHRGENDLLEPALDAQPMLVSYDAAMRSLGAIYHGMSGSGSSFYAVFADRATAERAQDVLKQRFEDADVFVCHPTDVGQRIEEGS